MILIAHRGNVYGPQSTSENHPDYVTRALDLGYDAEVDVWVRDGVLWLGHDHSEHRVNESLLMNPHVWCHAKHLDALDTLLTMGAHCFYHQDDRFTLTSQKYIWTYPGFLTTQRSVAVLTGCAPQFLPERPCHGVCSDYVGIPFDDRFMKFALEELQDVT